MVGGGGARDRAVAADDRRDSRSRATQRRGVARLSDAVDGLHPSRHSTLVAVSRGPVGASARAHRAVGAGVRPGSRRKSEGFVGTTSVDASRCARTSPSSSFAPVRPARPADGAGRLGRRRSAARRRDAEPAVRANRRQGRTVDAEPTRTTTERSRSSAASNRRPASEASRSSANTVTLFDCVRLDYRRHARAAMPCRSRFRMSRACGGSSQRSRWQLKRHALGERVPLVLVIVGGAVPHHRARRAGHGAGAGALDHELDPRALHGHRARPSGRLHAPHQHHAPRISSASSRVRSTR